MQLPKQLHGLILTLATAGLLCAGCSSEDGRPETYPVTGIVTLDNNPVDGATVTFVPKDGGTQAQGSAQAATAVTGADGSYSIGTFATGDGAVPGEYLVKVAKYSAPKQQQPVGDDPESQKQAFLQSRQGAQQPTGPKNELPEKYADEKTSGLFVTVEAKENTFNIELSR